MSFRFQKRPSLFGDFIRLNMSAHGLSVSIGVPGSRVCIPILGKNKDPSATVGIPGSGISYTKRLDDK